MVHGSGKRKNARNRFRLRAPLYEVSSLVHHPHGAIAAPLDWDIIATTSLRCLGGVEDYPNRCNKKGNLYGIVNVERG